MRMNPNSDNTMGMRLGFSVWTRSEEHPKRAMSPVNSQSNTHPSLEHSAIESIDEASHADDSNVRHEVRGFSSYSYRMISSYLCAVGILVQRYLSSNECPRSFDSIISLVVCQSHI